MFGVRRYKAAERELKNDPRQGLVGGAVGPEGIALRSTAIQAIDAGLVALDTLGRREKFANPLSEFRKRL